MIRFEPMSIIKLYQVKQKMIEKEIYFKRIKVYEDDNLKAHPFPYFE